ncbi:MAG: hypothetical protein VKJ24_08420 [Synechococcales bacterium]|nr:hypothetical protein [Synechococcales bacterium]
MVNANSDLGGTGDRGFCALCYLVFGGSYRLLSQCREELQEFSKAAGLEAISCINGDSDRDWNLSCTARNKDRLLAISCGYMPWSKGCKINFGQFNPPPVQFSLFKE